VVSFRYHLVSLIAVFMALATGILVGSSLLNQSLIDSQRSTISQQATEKDNLRRDLDTVNGEVLYRDQYLAQLDDRLLAGTMAGQRVVLVTLPGASGSDADGIAELLGKAGARVTGRVGVDSGWFTAAEDPRDQAAKAAAREEIVRKNPIPELRGQPADVQLAAALLTKGGADRTIAAPAKMLLDQLDRAGFLSKSGLEDRADLAVVLLGNPPDPAVAASDRSPAGLLSLATALRAAGSGVVVAGTTKAAAGSMMDAVRKNDATRSTISTVDTVETPFGRVATVFALIEQMAGGVGHYGSSPSANGPFPAFQTEAAKR
jgi:hypothetical protein